MYDLGEHVKHAKSFQGSESECAAFRNLSPRVFLCEGSPAYEEESSMNELGFSISEESLN